MKKSLFSIAISVFLLISCSDRENIIAEFTTQQFKIILDDKGEITNLEDIRTGMNYLAKDSSTYLMSIRVNNEVKFPYSALINGSQLTLQFDPNIEAKIEIDKEMYIIQLQCILY